MLIRCSNCTTPHEIEDSVLNKTGITTFKCSKCDKKNHIQLEGAFPITEILCPHCETSFVINAHKIKKENIRFTCSHCEQKFSKKMDMKHIKSLIDHFESHAQKNIEKKHQAEKVLSEFVSKHVVSEKNNVSQSPIKEKVQQVKEQSFDLSDKTLQKNQGGSTSNIKKETKKDESMRREDTSSNQEKKHRQKVNGNLNSVEQYFELTEVKHLKNDRIDDSEPLKKRGKDNFFDEVKQYGIHDITSDIKKIKNKNIKLKEFSSQNIESKLNKILEDENDKKPYIESKLNKILEVEKEKSPLKSSASYYFDEFQNDEVSEIFNENVEAKINQSKKKRIFFFSSFICIVIIMIILIII